MSVFMDASCAGRSVLAFRSNVEGADSGVLCSNPNFTGARIFFTCLYFCIVSPPFSIGIYSPLFVSTIYLGYRTRTIIDFLSVSWALLVTSFRVQPPLLKSFSTSFIYVVVRGLTLVPRPCGFLWITYLVMLHGHFYKRVPHPSSSCFSDLRCNWHLSCSSP